MNIDGRGFGETGKLLLKGTREGGTTPWWEQPDRDPLDGRENQGGEERGDIWCYWQWNTQAVEYGYLNLL
jgi:hypothetical protein